jgi:hypothetical protein
LNKPGTDTFLLLVTRQSPESYAARIVSPCAFIPCVGARDDATAELLGTAFQTWPIMAAKSLAERRRMPRLVVSAMAGGSPVPEPDR